MKKYYLYAVTAMLIAAMAGCQKESFTVTGMAKDDFFLKSGNQHMPVTVAGNVDSKKFMVIIHGGPGGNGLVYRDSHVKKVVEKEFAVVYWDQRFAGNTQGNGGDTDITVFRQDIKNLLLFLRTTYGADINLYLFGHSWGGFLAPYFLVEDDNQSMVQGWIQIGGAHNYHLNDSLTREMLLRVGNDELAIGNNRSDWNEIVDWCNENGFEGRTNAAKLNGFAHRAERLLDEVTEGDPSFDLLSTAILSQWSNMFASSIRKIDEPTYETPISDQLYKVNVPTLLLWGAYDFVCPKELAEDIELNIGSNDINKIIYPNSGHSPMINEQAAFWADVVEWVKEH